MMRTIQALRILTLAVLVGAATVARVDALPIVSLENIPPSWNPGDSFTIDIVVTDLGEPTGGINTDVMFDDATLDGTGYSFGAVAFNNPLDFVNGQDDSGGLFPNPPNPFSGNIANLVWTSWEDVLTLAAAQGPFPTGPLVLASIQFTATATGQGGFAIQNVDLSNNDGTALIPVCIEGQPCPVPEPTTFALFGAALAAFGARRFRRS
jgi:hypothetical protein